MTEDEKKLKYKALFASGVTYNPLSKHRNIKCPCGSGFKAKRCCGRMNVIPKDLAEALKRILPK